MIGDQQDMLVRLKATLPTRWFADQSPVLDAMLSGFGAAWSWLYDTLSFARAQSRLATASGLWLDMIGNDFFGAQLVRKPGQPDPSYRLRLQREMLRERGTRAALISVLTDLTGRPPTVFEPACPADTGSYGSLTAPASGLAYGMAGGWGSLTLPFQCFVTAFRPRGAGIAQLAGWSSGSGGFGMGASAYGSLDMIAGEVTDADIADAAASVVPAAAVAWLRITN